MEAHVGKAGIDCFRRGFQVSITAHGRGCVNACANVKILILQWIANFGLNEIKALAN